MVITKKKFSFVDILLALVMMAVLTGLYITTRENIGSQGIDAASRKVQSDIRYAQQLAVTSGVNHGVRFTAGGSYYVYSNKPENIVLDPVTLKKLTEDLSKFNGVHIVNNYHVEFGGEGEPVIGSNGKVRLTADGGDIRDIYVVEKSGAVVIRATK